MTTVVVNPQSPSDESPVQLIQLQVFVKGDQLEDYNLLEVWRSRSGSGGPYEELTAAQYLPATLPAGVGPVPTPAVTGPSVALNGLELDLKVVDTELTITFSGVDPITYADAASQIVAQGLGLLDSWVDSQGVLAVATMGAGTGASLEVTGGDAAPQLGLEVGSIGFGRSARVALIDEELMYLFSDIRGSKEYFYKTRFRNGVTGATSDFSLPVVADQALGVLPENVVCGQLDLVDLSGRPLCGYVVHVHAEYEGSLIEGKTVAGTGLRKQTDSNGHVEFTLVRGQKVSVAIPGTTLSRLIETPSDPKVSVFNLLDPEVSKTDDLFKVAVPKIVTAERRTL